MTINESHFKTFPVLKTRRLTLREFRDEDADVIYQMRKNAMVGRFMPRQLMDDPQEAQKLCASVQEAYANRQGLAWVALLRDRPTMIGACGFNSIEAMNLRAEIGGEMLTEYWGKGIAQEAVKEIVRFGLEDFGLHTIEAKVSPNNRGAVYVLEQLGFEKEAHYKDRWIQDGRFEDMAVYTLFNQA